MTWKNLRRSLGRGAVLALLVAGQVTFAQVGSLAKRVNIYLKDADLYEATQMLTRQTGIQFVIAPNAGEFGKINLSLASVSAEEAIKYICQAAGGYAEADENGVFIIRFGQPPVKGSTGSGTSVKKPTKIDRIKIVNADVRDVYGAIFKGYLIDPDRGMMEMDAFQTKSPYNNGFGIPQTMIGPGGSVIMGNAEALPTRSSKTNDLPTDSGTVNGSANDISIPGEAAFQRSGGAGGGGGALGGGGAAGGGGAGGAGGGALQAGTGFTPDGIRRVTYDPTDNSLIVEGDDEAIQQLRQLVAFFDQVPKQVVIKVEFITTSQSIIKSLGMDWLYQRGAVNAGNRPGTLARVSDPIFINYATGNITTRLRTLINEGDGKTVNAPLVRTLNNQTAIVNQTTQTTVFLASTTNGAGGVTTTFNPTTLTINTGLQVRPRINDDGWVTMTLAPQISDFGQVRRGPDGQEIPDVLSQQIRVVARVRSGQTIALAGLNRKSTTNSTSRFPILSDLPIIGQLFRSSSVQRNDSELLIFVTPYVVEDDTNGGLTP
jgi:general secretion pathway protein D